MGRYGELAEDAVDTGRYIGRCEERQGGPGRYREPAGGGLAELGGAPRLHALAVPLVRIGLLALGGGELDLVRGWG